MAPGYKTTDDYISLPASDKATIDKLIEAQTIQNSWESTDVDLVQLKEQYEAGFQQSKYDAALGCDNFVLEMHYKVYFTAATEGQVLSDDRQVQGVPWSLLRSEVMTHAGDPTAWVGFSRLDSYDQALVIELIEK